MSSSRTRRRWRIVSVSSLLAAIAAALSLPGCEVWTPFRGPGYSRSKGVTLSDVGDHVVVALTHATLDPANRGVFDDYTQHVLESLPQSEGLVGYSVRKQLLGNEVWTMTVWRDHDSIDRFVTAPSHKEAMRQGMAPVLEAQFHRMEWPAASVPPSWSDMKRALESVEIVRYGPRDN